MIDFSDVNGKLDTFLGDDSSEGKGRFSLALRVNSWNWAQDVFSAHTAREMQVSLVIERDTRSAVLPPDFIQDAFLWASSTSSEKTYNKTRFSIGGTRSGWADNEGYWIWANKIYLDKVVTVTDGLILYYWASWPNVTVVNDAGMLKVQSGSIYVPQWATLPLMHLTAANVLEPEAIAAAMERTYNIMVDSGKPTDNSRAAQAREHWWWYTQLIGLHPVQNRMGGAAP